MSTAEAKIDANIEARVFRVKQKPRVVPLSIWNYLCQYHTGLTHRTENLGIIASTKDGTVQIINCKK